jgi:hypothetical protein
VGGFELSLDDERRNFAAFNRSERQRVVPAPIAPVSELQQQPAVELEQWPLA